MAVAFAPQVQIPWWSRDHRWTLTDNFMDETALVAEVVARRESALESVYRSYGGAVKAIARRVIKDDDLAEDVVQDVFVTFWDNPHGFDPDRGSLRTYLLTIAHRRAVDVVRSEQARSLRQERVTPDPPAIDLENEVWLRTQSEAVRAAVGRLAPHERKAISLAYFGGLSYVEVARALDEPEGTIKSRIRSGMRKLADSLEGVRA